MLANGTAGSKQQNRVSALALTAPAPILASTVPFPVAGPAALSFLTFLATRCRVWAMSEEPLDTPLTNAMAIEIVPKIKGHSGLELCHAVSGGDGRYDENIVIEARESIIRWINEVLAVDREKQGEYAHPEMEVKHVEIPVPEEINWGSEQQGWMAQQVEIDANGEEVAQDETTGGRIVEVEDT